MIASTYLAVRGDISAPLSAKEVFVIAEKPFTSLFGQPFVLTKIMTPKILDHDTATPFVVFLLRTGNVKSRCALLVVHFLQ